MALETERCSPSNASSPGPTSNRRPGSEGGSSSGCPQSKAVKENGNEEHIAMGSKPRSAFHQIALLAQFSSESQDTSISLTFNNRVQNYKDIGNHSAEITEFNDDIIRTEETRSTHSADSAQCITEESSTVLPERTMFISQFTNRDEILHRTLSNDSSSNHSNYPSPSVNPPYSAESSSPTSPILPVSPDHRNDFPVDARLSGNYRAEIPPFSLVYGLGMIPRFPINFHLPPGAYTDVDRGFQSLARLPTAVSKPSQPAESLASRNVHGCKSSMDGGKFNTIKNHISQKIPKDCQRLPVTAGHRYPDTGYRPSSSCSSASSVQGSRCNYCRSPSPRVPPSRSPSPNRQHPPGPSSLTFSVDNILRPEFGRTALISSNRTLKRSLVVTPQPVSRLPKNTVKTTSSSDVLTIAQPQKSPTPSNVSGDSQSNSLSDNKDSNGQVWPAWVYCTRYSDRPSSGKRKG